MKNEITPASILAEYSRGKRYKEGIGLYDKVKLCERFYEGDQWHGLKSMTVRPMIMNFTRRLFSYFCAMVVSDDIGISVEPFEPEETARQAASVLEAAVERVMERQKMRTVNREALRDAGVDGDSVLYFWFDPEQRTGMEGVSGDIACELLMNTNIIFGNPYSADVQRQPYLILVQRQPVQQVRKEAKAAGSADWDKIEPDEASEYKGEDDCPDGELATKLTRFWKQDGQVFFMQSCGERVVRGATATGMTRYPIAYMSWLPKKNSCHGIRAMEEIIPAQIAVNQMWTAVNLHIQGLAFPKVVYNMQMFPNGWNGAPGKAVGVQGDPREAATGVVGGVQLPTVVLDVLERTISTARDCAGASDAALGNIERPDNKGAIQAVQQASAAPLELQKLGFYQMVEDYVRIMIDMMHAYYGVRAVKVTRRETDPMSGEETERSVVEVYDFSALPVDALDLDVNIGPASYWSELARSATLDGLLSAGVIQDALDYLERIPDNAIPDKAGLIEKMKRRQKAAQLQAAQMGGVTG